MFINIIEFKNRFGESFSPLTEEEIARIHEIEYAIADVLFEKWLRKRNTQTLEEIEF